MKKILIIGSYGAGNLGDEAMLSVMIKNLSSQYELMVLSGNPKDTSRRHNISSAVHFPFGLRSLFSLQAMKSLSFLKSADYVLLGGGGLFTDSYTKKAVLLWAWHLLICTFFKKRVIAFANSIGPFKSSQMQKVAALALSKTEAIFVRDEKSERLVKEMCPQSRVFGGTDIVFDLNIKRTAAKKNLIYLNLRDWQMDYTIVKDFILELQGAGKNIIFVPMEEDDLRILREKLNLDLEVYQPKSLEELSSRLGEAEACIGMRLHFLVAATMSGAPLMGLSYATKVSSLLDQFNLPYVASETLLLSRLRDKFKEARSLTDLKQARRRIKDMFKQLVIILEEK